ncbi:hypothetical protein F7725_001143 [Dissostichus mawsoni]|uniref:Uncharacterized protein n=1 Tax=Dissostichus mawsoni TaxID=36200 RepID=A0A7J5ZKI4_DISMA|nr:hypothetical protein F7725_001143 [Dissostichus mawsoni]
MKPLYRSLLILPKHVVLFALHVLKVKVAAGHALVDVLDVVAGGLEVSGGIVGAGGEDLGEIKQQTENLQRLCEDHWETSLEQGHADFWSMGSSSSSAGSISASGSPVSTVVLMMAMYFPWAATL